MQKQQMIENLVREKLSPDYLEIINESYMHSVPAGSESHFKLVLVTEQFSGLRSVARHQKVYAVLGDVMQQIHALALHTYTPEEWRAQGVAPASPQCMGGSKHDQPH